MAFAVERLWNPQDAAGLSRKGRTPGRYLAYVPEELGAQLPSIGREAQQAAKDALAVLARAEERIGARGGYLNRVLIRSESISSSWIEPRLEPGRRTEQNWVGGPGWSPLRADFVPPTEAEVRCLVDDLALFVTETSGNPIVRAAIAHAQFETTHPFIDGNGRTGRALIHTVLRRSAALRNTLMPISTVFAGAMDAYIAGLTAFREDPPRLDDWVIAFAGAAELAAANALRLASDIAALDESTLNSLIDYRQKQGISPARPRRDAATLKVLETLATEPVLTVETVSARHGVSRAAAHRALLELAECGILGRNKEHKGRLICWTADRHLALVALTERSNRVGGGDTECRRPRLGPAAPASSQTGLLRPGLTQRQPNTAPSAQRRCEPGGRARSSG